MQVEPELHTIAPFSHIQFSADGKLMLCVAEGRIYQIDAFGGALLQTYSTGIPEGTKGPAAIFSPDSRYILSGTFGKPEQQNSSDTLSSSCPPGCLPAHAA